LYADPHTAASTLPIATEIIAYCGKDRDTVPESGVSGNFIPVGAPEEFID